MTFICLQLRWFWLIWSWLLEIKLMSNFRPQRYWYSLVDWTSALFIGGRETMKCWDWVWPYGIALCHEYMFSKKFPEMACPKYLKISKSCDIISTMWHSCSSCFPLPFSIAFQISGHVFSKKNIVSRRSFQEVGDAFTQVCIHLHRIIDRLQGTDDEHMRLRMYKGTIMVFKLNAHTKSSTAKIGWLSKCTRTLCPLIVRAPICGYLSPSCSQALKSQTSFNIKFDPAFALSLHPIWVSTK